MNRNACEIYTFYFYAQKPNKTKNRIYDFTGMKSKHFFSPTKNAVFEYPSGGEGTDKV